MAIGREGPRIQDTELLVSHQAGGDEIGPYEHLLS
jgi:hypothetical protein